MNRFVLNLAQTRFYKPLNSSTQAQNSLKFPNIVLILFTMTIIPYISFAHADLDTDPFSPGTQFDSKPLDEAEQEDKEVSDVWTISIIIVASLLIVRIAFKIIKKRRSQSN